MINEFELLIKIIYDNINSLKCSFDSGYVIPSFGVRIDNFNVVSNTTDSIDFYLSDMNKLVKIMLSIESDNVEFLCSDFTYFINHNDFDFKEDAFQLSTLYPFSKESFIQLSTIINKIRELRII